MHKPLATRCPGPASMGSRLLRRGHDAVLPTTVVRAASSIAYAPLPVAGVWWMGAVAFLAFARRVIPCTSAHSTGTAMVAVPSGMRVRIASSHDGDRRTAVRVPGDEREAVQVRRHHRAERVFRSPARPGANAAWIREEVPPTDHGTR